MNRIIEKFIIALISSYIFYRIHPSKELAFYLIVAIILSMMLDLVSTKKYRNIIYISFGLLGLYDSSFLVYLPLILYNLHRDYGKNSFFALALVFIDFHISLILLSLFSIYFSNRLFKTEDIIASYRSLRDRLKHDKIALKNYNKELKLDKEKDIEIAILKERNRMAREIHDSVGHTISSSILQVNALKFKIDESERQQLDLLQHTLENGMNDIRSSVRGLRDESFNLKYRLEKIIEETPNIKIHLKYNIRDELPYNLKFDIYSIIRESITNTIKHSDANSLNIKLLSQPSFYLISIKDNGSLGADLENKGLGLHYIEDTARKYRGSLNYSFENGFKIHINLMKGDVYENSNCR